MTGRDELIRWYKDHRSFEEARHQKTIVNGADKSFRVMTYNLLSHIKREAFPYCGWDTLKWAYRRERIMAEVAAYEADICCFQVGRIGFFDPPKHWSVGD